MILVITYTANRTEFDERGRIVEEGGTVYVSHGVNIKNGKTVVLPQERFSEFRPKCTMIEGEWYIV